MLYTTALNKAKDCNSVYEKNKDNSSVDKKRHNDAIQEVIISIEILDKAIDYYGHQYGSNDCYYFFWKQLTPEFRGFIQDDFKKEVDSSPNNEYYSDYYNRIKDTLSPHFDERKGHLRQPFEH